VEVVEMTTATAPNRALAPTAAEIRAVLETVRATEADAVVHDLTGAVKDLWDDLRPSEQERLEVLIEPIYKLGDEFEAAVIEAAIMAGVRFGEEFPEAPRYSSIDATARPSNRVAPIPISPAAAAANEQAADVHRKLDPDAQRPARAPYLRLEETMSELVSDAMLAIGAVTTSGDLDPKATEIFGDLRDVTDRITDVLAEHVYKATRSYLEQKAAMITETKILDDMEREVEDAVARASSPATPGPRAAR
jgi:hypothetical protein